MHKKMQALSLLCRRLGDPPGARRAIGRAQCNDAYWHGVFGGLYLPHLREAIWRNLASAEAELRRGQGLGVEVFDLDGDGHDEIWIHSDQFSAVISPRRGGALEEYTIFGSGMNYANTLTAAARPTTTPPWRTRPWPRRRGWRCPQHSRYRGWNPPGAASALDADPRALFVDRVLPSGLGIDQYAGGDYWPACSWAQSPCGFSIERQEGVVEVVCSFPGSAPGTKALERRMAFSADGSLTVSYRWDQSIGHPDDLFAPELSLFAPLELRSEPAAEIWTFPIETVAKSERGLDRTRQGDSVTLRWPVHLGEASVEVDPTAQVSVAPAEVGQPAELG